MATAPSSPLSSRPRSPRRTASSRSRRSTRAPAPSSRWATCGTASSSRSSSSSSSRSSTRWPSPSSRTSTRKRWARPRRACARPTEADRGRPGGDWGPRAEPPPPSGEAAEGRRRGVPLPRKRPRGRGWVRAGRAALARGGCRDRLLEGRGRRRGGDRNAGGLASCGHTLTGRPRWRPHGMESTLRRFRCSWEDASGRSGSERLSRGTRRPSGT
mmetsp:Transcript_25484/g.68261  ORF Transcript_25484/g.68261 Transcript_25484/m.68261 type:complete len:214 (+) Transcript_25484:682-1323(+)